MWFARRGRGRAPERGAEAAAADSAGGAPSSFGIPGLLVSRSAADAPVSVWTFDADVAAGRVRGGRFAEGAPERLARALEHPDPPDGLVVANQSAASGDGAISEGYADAVAAACALRRGWRRPAFAATGPTAVPAAAGPVIASLEMMTPVLADAEEDAVCCSFPLLDEAGAVQVAGWFWRDPAVMVLASDLPLGRDAARWLLDQLWAVGPGAWSVGRGPHPGDALMLLSSAPGKPLAAADPRAPTLLRAWRLAAEMLVARALGSAPSLRIEGAASAAELLAAAAVWVPAADALRRLPPERRAERLFRAMAATPLAGLERSRMQMPPYLSAGRPLEMRGAPPDACTLDLGRGLAGGLFPLQE